MKEYVRMILFLVILSAISAAFLTAFSVETKDKIEQNKKYDRFLHILKSMRVLPQVVETALEKDVDIQNLQKEAELEKDAKLKEQKDYKKEQKRIEKMEYLLKQQTMEQFAEVFKNSITVLEVDIRQVSDIKIYKGEEFLSPQNAKNINYMTKLYIFKAKDKSGNFIYSFEVFGTGFWDRVSGYLTLKQGFRQMSGLSFYDNKETPGLGKRIEEGWFQGQFSYLGKSILPQEGYPLPEIKISPRQGSYEGDCKAKSYNEVDAITGASETSRAVNRFVSENLRNLFKLMTQIRENKMFGEFFDTQTAEFFKNWHEKNSESLKKA